MRPRPGSLRPAVRRCTGCGLIGQDVPGVPQGLLPGRSATPITSTRWTSIRCSTIRNLEGLCSPTHPTAGKPVREPAGRNAGTAGSARPGAALPRRRQVDEQATTPRKGCAWPLGALRRIRMPEEDIATIEFLIRHHLRMSTVLAFRRDVRRTRRPSCGSSRGLVGTEQRLKLLCLLTLVGRRAPSGPDVMTPWKEELLWRFYVDAYNRLTLGYGDDVIDDRRGQSSPSSAFRAGPRKCRREELEAFLDGLPRALPARSWIARAGVRARAPVARSASVGDVRLHAGAEGHSAWELATIVLGQPARPVLEACAACCPTSAWTSCAARR